MPRCRSLVERSPVTRWPGRAGLRPLVAAVTLTRLARPSRQAVTPEHLPDRRAGTADDPGEAAGAKVGAAASLQDRLLPARREPTGPAVRPRGTIDKRRIETAAFQPAVPPAVHSRGRHAEAGRGPPQRKT